MADSMLGELGLADAELSVVLTGDRTIQALNRKHRGKDQPTDVLAFPMDETWSGAPVRLLGDVVISLQTAGRQAEDAGHSLVEETAHLLAHGILHLVGYDHSNRAESVAMRAMTKRLVASAGYPGRPTTKDHRVQRGRAKAGTGKR